MFLRDRNLPKVDCLNSCNKRAWTKLKSLSKIEGAIEAAIVPESKLGVHCPEDMGDGDEVGGNSSKVTEFGKWGLVVDEICWIRIKLGKMAVKHAFKMEHLKLKNESFMGYGRKSKDGL